jgi:hypothetical protein
MKIPEGWQLVPKEPTDEMVLAGFTAIHPSSGYKAMLAAAPKYEGDDNAPQ